MPNENNDFRRFENMRSWKEMRYEGVVEQSLEYSCGAASIATILRFYYGQDITEADIEKLLPKKRATFFELKEAVNELSEKAIGLYISKSQIVHLNLPAIAHIVTPFSNNHFVVIRGIGADNTVLLGDPSVGNVRVDLETFYDMWLMEKEDKGKVLIIQSKNDVDATYFSKAESPMNVTELVAPTHFDRVRNSVSHRWHSLMYH
ncbi:C39 family peptidase [Tamilnaduibacter salinus]|nr:cysteine peptidase family C39 domain-containing protein [Tamilnaduibacter salinus]